ncbi:MAG TPA: Gfo/Idh/MocA family oxidoreductase [Candidatus Acidoferrum sp.]|nr:Gfo/Idh/MocA family oxidoreductase [Candidatus Acidoferrum sp.]
MGIFRLGVAGAGRMGRNHIAAIAASDKVRVVSIAEPGAAARELLAGKDAAVYTDLDSMLAAGGLDGVLVCVPSDLHLQTVSRLIDAGLPILCEKPCGVTHQEALEATRLAAEASLPLQIGFWRRFVPALQKLRYRIGEGELGGVYLVACYQWDGVPPGANFRTHSGGIFIDMGVHEFDQARWLTGQEFGAISALASGVEAEPWPGDPESAQALAAMSGGTTAIVSLGRRYPLGDVCKVEVFGTKGAEECRFLWPPDADATFEAALREQAESFARHVRGGPLEGAGGHDVAEAVAAAERAASASGLD